MLSHTPLPSIPFSSPTPIPIRSTPFPSHLLDSVMPTLRDTEWRLLCVVVRQTLGWQEAANRGSENGADNAGRVGRKERDWLTHSQLRAKTGRSGEAVSRALDTLVRRSLVEALDEDGRSLATPQARQKHAGRLYFRLAPGALQGDRHTQHTAPDPYEDKSRASIQGRISAGEGYASEAETLDLNSKEEAPQSEAVTSKTETPTSLCRLRKAETTKETENKRKNEKVPLKTPSPVDNSGENASTQAQTAYIAPAYPGTALTQTAGGVNCAVTDEEVRRFLRLYCDRFQERSTQGDPPPLSWNKEGALVRRLLLTYGRERLTQLLHAYFASEDAWARKCGYSLAAFQHLLPNLLMGEPRHSTSKPKHAAQEQTALIVHGPSAVWVRAANTASGAEPEPEVSSASLLEHCPDLARRLRSQPP